MTLTEKDEGIKAIVAPPATKLETLIQSMRELNEKSWFLSTEENKASDQSRSLGQRSGMWRNLLEGFKNFHKDYGYERSHPGLSELGCWHDSQRTPLQDGDHSGNDPCSVPGFLRQRSGMFLERFRRMLASVGSRGIRLTWTAPKLRDSVLLNSWDSFLVSLPSIS